MPRTAGRILPCLTAPYPTGMEALLLSMQAALGVAARSSRNQALIKASGGALGNNGRRRVLHWARDAMDSLQLASGVQVAGDDFTAAKRPGLW